MTDNLEELELDDIETEDEEAPEPEKEEDRPDPKDEARQMMKDVIREVLSELQPAPQEEEEEDTRPSYDPEEIGKSALSASVAINHARHELENHPQFSQLGREAIDQIIAGLALQGPGAAVKAIKGKQHVTAATFMYGQQVMDGKIKHGAKPQVELMKNYGSGPGAPVKGEDPLIAEYKKSFGKTPSKHALKMLRGQA